MLDPAYHNAESAHRPAGHTPGSSSHPATLPEEPALPWRLWVGVIIARRWIILGVAAAVFLGAALHTYRLPNVYRATTRLLIERDNPKLLDVQEIFQVAENWQNEYYQTQCKILESRRIGERACRVLNLYADPDLTGLNDPVAAFLGAVRIQPVRNSRLVDVSVDHGEPAKAAAWANALAAEYIADSIERRSGVGREALVQLTKESDDMRTRLEAREKAMQEFREQHALVALNERQSLLERRLEELTTAATTAEREQRDLGAGQEKLAALTREGRWDALFALPQVQGNTLLQRIREEQVRLLQERQEMLKTYRDKHPKLLAVQSRLDSVEESLRQEAGRIAEGIRTAYEEASERATQARAALEAAKAEKVRFDRDVIELSTLQRDAEALRSLFQNVLKRIQETNVASQLDVTNISVVDRAQVPAGPVSPNRRMNLLMGLAAGIALGLAAAFLVEQIDSRIDAPEEAERAVGGPLLGVIPHISLNGNGSGSVNGNGSGAVSKADAGREPEEASYNTRAMRAIVLGDDDGGNGNGTGDGGNRNGAVGPELICHNDMKSLASEAFRAVRTAVQFAGKANGDVRTLVVVSVAPLEGKTITALNLAIAMAQVGHRVLVVDADLRRPRLHRALGIGNDGRGLSDLLRGRATLDEAVRPTAVEGLSVVTAGAIPPNPSELLSSPRLDEFLREAETRYDRILFDSPPVGAVTDACVLAPNLDGVLHVIGFGKTSRHEVREGRRQLVSLGARYLGAVLNDVPVSRRKYMRGYRYGYGYGSHPRYGGYYETAEESKA